MMNKGNVEGDEVGEGCRADFIPCVLGSYWEMESRAILFDKIPEHYRRITLAVLRAREEAKRTVRGSFNDPRQR